MMKMNYDPGDGEQFWDAIKKIDGFPKDDEIPLKIMLFISGAIYKLPEVLKQMKIPPEAQLLIVMDPTPMRRIDTPLKPLVLNILAEAGYHLQSLVLDPGTDGQVHTDMNQIEAVKNGLKPDTPVISVGSGVVTDITKHACYLYERETGVHLPFIVYQTANSVSAYSSSMAPVFIDGVKRTLNSRYPEALICDLETLRDAPREMTVAGVGDLLAVFVSFADWYLANQLGMDPTYSQFAEVLIGHLDEILLDYADEICQTSLEGMAILAKLITLGGLAMSLSHATTPMSGYEHVMSHVLDLLNEIRHRPLAMHGTQVAMTSLLGTAAYEVFLEEFAPKEVQVEYCFPDLELMENRVLSTFLEVDPSGKVGQECWSDYRQKLGHWYDRRTDLERFLADWPAISQAIHKRTCHSEGLLTILRKIDSPIKFDQLKPPAGEEEARFAFFNAPLLRKRFTLGDLLIFLNWDREKLWRQVWPRVNT